MSQPVEPRPLSKRARWVGAMGVSLAAHIAVVLSILMTWANVRPPREPSPIAVTLVEAPLPPAPAPAAAPKAPTPLPKRDSPPPPPKPSPLVSRPAPPATGTGSGMGLSDSQLAGAASADSGVGGRECDMARRLQAALRKDPLVQAAVAGEGSRAIMVWNGDWIQSPTEDGKGLAAVREAVMWQIAFSPPACRAESMRGLVTLSLNAAPGGARLALGSSQWRWSDLIASREASVR